MKKVLGGDWSGPKIRNMREAPVPVYLEQDEKPLRDGATHRAKCELIETLRSCVRELLTHYEREEACRALFFVIDNEFKEAEV